MKENISEIIDLFTKFMTNQVLVLVIILIFRKNIFELLSSFSSTVSRVSGIKGIEFVNISQDMNDLIENNPKKTDKKEIEKWYKFEKIYRVIYGSQISLLDALNSYPTSNENIKFYYNKASDYYSESYKTISLEQWTQFLIKKGLCVEENGVYKITDFGIEFLLYLVKNGMNKNKIL
jgi:hypothetical protein